MKITIEVDGDDFDQLRTNTMQWHGLGWHDQPGRFRPVTGGDVEWGHQLAYWFDDVTSMILGRAYLNEVGETHQVLWDEVDSGSPYVITTNYTSKLVGEREGDGRL